MNPCVHHNYRERNCRNLLSLKVQLLSMTAYFFSAHFLDGCLISCNLLLGCGMEL